MATIRNYMTEIVLVVSTLVFLIFTATNVSNRLGVTYLQFLFGSLALLFVTLLIFDKNVEVTVKKKNTSLIEEFFFGAAGWVILLVGSYVAINFTGKPTTFGAIFSSLGAANPIFSESVIINFLIIAFAIPFIETQFFARLMEFTGDIFKVRINKSNRFGLGFVVILIFLSLLFMIFHATAKSLSGQSLLIVFIMMAISLFLVVQRDGDTRAAIFMHILANGVAAYLLISSGGVLNFGG